MDKPFDYRTQPQGVELIVRPNSRYGAALPGQRVLVDVSELKNRSTMTSCMTVEEADEIEKVREQKAAAAAEALVSRNSVKSIVEAGLERIEDSVRAAKAAAEYDRQSAEKLEGERAAAEAEIARAEEPDPVSLPVIPKAKRAKAAKASE